MSENKPTAGSGRKRRWFQFSLRGLMLMTAVIAAWLIYEARQHAKEEALIQQARALDPRLEVTWQAPVWWAHIFGGRTAGLLERVAKVKMYCEDLTTAQVTALQLERLGSLEQLELFNLMDLEDDGGLEMNWHDKIVFSYQLEEELDDNLVEEYRQNPTAKNTKAILRAMQHPLYVREAHSEPDELSYGCIRFGDGRESAIASLLTVPDESMRISAAESLWKMHSRVHAQGVITLVEQLQSTTPAAQKIKAQIAADLQKDSILKELKQGSQNWGSWLAMLRPHPDLTKELIAAVESGRATLSTIYALGKSNDPQVVPVLVDSLGNVKLIGNNVIERALVPFGNEVLEKELLARIPQENDYFACEAASVLGKIGTLRSVPTLEKMATDPKYDQAPINVHNVSELAAQEIKSRAERNVSPNDQAALRVDGTQPPANDNSQSP